MEDCAKRIAQVNALHLRLGVSVSDLLSNDDLEELDVGAGN
jgi:hypothetical protein